MQKFAFFATTLSVLILSAQFSSATILRTALEKVELSLNVRQYKQIQKSRKKINNKSNDEKIEYWNKVFGKVFNKKTGYNTGIWLNFGVRDGKKNKNQFITKVDEEGNVKVRDKSLDLVEIRAKKKITHHIFITYLQKPDEIEQLLEYHTPYRPPFCSGLVGAHSFRSLALNLRDAFIAEFDKTRTAIYKNTHKFLKKKLAEGKIKNLLQLLAICEHYLRVQYDEQNECRYPENNYEAMAEKIAKLKQFKVFWHNFIPYVAKSPVKFKHISQYGDIIIHTDEF